MIRGKSQSRGKRVKTLSLLMLGLMTVSVSAQELRKAIAQPVPEYPVVARRAGLSGTVKVQVVIGADGQIKEVKVIGGHPLFVDATLEALKKWRFAPSGSETTTVLDFKFHP
jgi:TonB family protein